MDVICGMQAKNMNIRNLPPLVHTSPSFRDTSPTLRRKENVLFAGGFRAGLADGLTNSPLKVEEVRRS